MHDIISIESIKLTEEDDIQFIAILENMDAAYRTKQHLTVPDVAPVKCRTIIDRASLPHWLNLKDLDEEGLQEIVNRYGCLGNQNWEILIPKFQGHTHNNTPR
jgi:hypothetical protein